MIVTVTLNPAVDKVARLDKIKQHEVNRLTKVESDAGGKGINVSRTIKTLHGYSIATGFLGGSGGNFIDCLLQREEIDSHMIHIIGNTRSNLKIVDDENQMSEFNEEGPFILQNEQDELFDYLRINLDQECVLVISGSMPKGMSRSTYYNLIEMAKEKYKNYLYIEIMPEESKNAVFYEKHGFQRMNDGVAMQLCNFSNQY